MKALEIQVPEAAGLGRSPGPHPRPRPHPRPPGHHQVVRRLLAAADALAVLGACGVVTLAWSIATGLPIGHEPGIVGLSIGAPFVWLATSVACHAHRARCAGTAVDELASLFRAGALTMAGLALLGIALGARVPRTWLVGVGLLATLAVATVRMAVRWWLAVEHRQRWTETRIVVVGAGDEGRQLARAFRDDPDSHLRPVAFVDDRLPPGARVGDLAVAGPVASAVDRARALAASGLVLTGALGPERLAATVRAGLAAGLEVQLSSQLSDVAHNRLVPLAAGRSPLVRVEPSVRRGWRVGAKRALDVLLAGGALVLVAPVLVVAMVLVKRETSGPALFRQSRVGRDGKPFTMFKVRTMVADAESLRAALLDRNEADGPMFKLADDPRVTKVGRVLRKLSIDELPQLLNVLLGHMSLVGPRPALPAEVAEWPAGLDERLRVRPGITGLWQVSGRSDCTFDDYARFDLYYVDNWSLATDLAILVRTVPVVLLGNGAR